MKNKTKKIAYIFVIIILILIGIPVLLKTQFSIVNITEDVFRNSYDSENSLCQDYEEISSDFQNILKNYNFTHKETTIKSTKNISIYTGSYEKTKKFDVYLVQTIDNEKDTCEYYIYLKYNHFISENKFHNNEMSKITEFNNILNDQVGNILENNE